MVKFKTGDKVRVKTGLQGDKYYGGTYFNTSMEKYCGKEVTIQRVLASGQYHIKGCGWYWTAEMFEEIKPKTHNVYSEERNVPRFLALRIDANMILAIQTNLVKVIENGETVICFFREAGKDTLFKTIAKCQEGDNYRLTSGVKICCHKANIKVSERALKKF